MKNQIIKNSLYLFLLLSVAFSFIICRSYVYHNDLGYWTFIKPFFQHAEEGHLIIFGRPLGALFLNGQTFLLNKFHNIVVFNVMRASGVFLFLGLTCLVDYALTKYTALTRQQRFIVVLVMFTQPSWFVSLVWVSNIIPGIVSYLLGLLAALLLPTPLASNRKHLYLAAASLLAAFYCYPSGALAFFWIPLIRWSLGTGEFAWRDWFNRGMFFGVTTVFGLLLHYLLIKPVLCKFLRCVTWVNPNSKEYSLALSTHVLEKLSVLWESLKVVAGSWFRFFDNLPVFFLLGFLLMFLAILPAVKDKRFSILQQSLITLMVGCGFILLFNLPNLITNGAVVAFRTVAPATIFLGIGMIKLLTLFEKKIAGVFQIGVVLVYILTATFISEKVTHTYHDALTKLITNPQLGISCITSEANWVDPYRASCVAGIYPLDFGLDTMVSWTLPSICRTHLYVRHA